MTRVGVVGAGAWGVNHVRTLHHMGHLGVVVESSSTRADEIRRTVPDVTIVATIDDAAAIEPSIGALVIATPVPTHAAIATQALEAGFHVLVEKPLAMSRLDAHGLLKKAAAKERTLMVGHLALFNAASTELRRLVAEGSLGRLCTLALDRLNFGTARVDENAMWSLGVHDVALALSVASGAVHVVAAHGRAVRGRPAHDIYAHIRCGGPDSEVDLHLHASWLWPTKRRGFTAIFERGMVVADEVNGTFSISPRRVGDDLDLVDGPTTDLKLDGRPPLELELEHFMASIESGSRPMSDGALGVQVVEALEAIDAKMYETGVVV